MKYAQEIIDLMGAYPGRAFRMREIVNSIVGKEARVEERYKIRKGVCRVLHQLSTVGSIAVMKQKERGAFARYVWKK